MQLAVRDGRVVVDPAKTTLRLELVGERGRELLEECGYSAEELKDRLTRELDRQLRDRGTILEQRTLPEARAELPALVERNPAARNLSTLSDDWRAADARVLQDVARFGADRRLLQPGGYGLYEIFKAIVDDTGHGLADGPLILLTDDPDEDDRFREGRLPFGLAAPITPEYEIKPLRNVAQLERRRGTLGAAALPGLRCDLWHRDAVVDRVSDYLVMRGIAVQPYRSGEAPPLDQAGISPEKPGPDRAGEDAEKEGVLLASDLMVGGILLNTDDGAAIDRALYLLLPSSDYDEVAAHRRDYLCRTAPISSKDEHGETVTTSYVDLRLLGAQGSRLRIARAYLTRRYLSERVRALAAGGFAVVPRFPIRAKPAPEGGEADGLPEFKWIHLLVSPTDDIPAARVASPHSGEESLPSCAAPLDPDAPRDAAPLSDAQGTETARPEAIARTGGRDSEARTPRSDPEHPNHLRAGVEYAAGRPLRFTAGYTRTGVTGDDALSLQLGAQDQVLGNLEYDRDFVGFHTLGRRLQLALRGFSDFTPEVPLSSGNADERRSGAETRATLDLSRDVDQQWWQLDGGLGWRQSTTERHHDDVARTQITLLDLGLHYLRSWDGTPSSARLQVDPIVAVGYAGGPDRGAYTRPGLDARYHQFVGPFVQWELHAAGATAIGHPPEVELPAFGGESSVRGYGADAGLAKTVWAVQNEAWLPIRVDLCLPKDWSPFLRRNVALAFFGDVGGLHHSVDSFDGVKWGAGLGLRLLWQDTLTLRLDWGHALGDPQHAPGAGAVYFSVTTWRGF